MRLAMVDLLFSWPPHGGADVDVLKTTEGLQELGHDVHLFVCSYDKSWERGKFDPGALPFPSTRLDFTAKTFNRRELPQRLRRAVDEWRPDVVFAGDGFFLKPYVTEALSHHKIVSRYYAYELVCPRDLRLFKNGVPCPNNYLRTPDTCRKCAVEHLKHAIEHWRLLSWEQEYLSARAFMPGYYELLARSLRNLDAIIVYNDLMKQQTERFQDNVRVFPGGVDTRQFEYARLRDKDPATPKIILMTGRVEDPLKGLDTLREAGRIMAQERDDFEVWATHSNRSLSKGWFQAVGWHDHDGIIDLYAQADICVVPSVWEEPFGMTALEAMAAGRPVCASRAGGLQNTVRNGDTGFLFERGDSAALARVLGTLLDDYPLRSRMGDRARNVAVEEYDWRRIIERYYPPLLEELTA